MGAAGLVPRDGAAGKGVEAVEAVEAVKEGEEGEEDEAAAEREPAKPGSRVAALP
jgi:hypothetical protein